MEARKRRKICDNFITLLSTYDPHEVFHKNEAQEIDRCVSALRGEEGAVSSSFEPLVVCASGVLFVGRRFDERYRVPLAEAAVGLVELLGMHNTTDLLKLCLTDDYETMLAMEVPPHVAIRARLTEYAVESDSAAELVARCSPSMCCACIEILCLFVHLTCKRSKFTATFTDRFFGKNVSKTRLSLLKATRAHLARYKWMDQDAVLLLLDSR